MFYIAITHCLLSLIIDGPGTQAVNAAINHRGNTSEDFFGLSLASIPDVNADGCPDIAVGAPLDSRLASRAGSVWIISGRDQSTIWSKSASKQDDWYGYGLASVRDVNRDGINDIIIGAPGFEGNGAGYVEVRAG